MTPGILPGLESISVLPGLDVGGLTGATSSPALATSGASLDSGGWVVLTGGGGRELVVLGALVVLALLGLVLVAAVGR